MRTLKLNQQPFEYKAYLGKQEILNDGRHTGKYEMKYADPVGGMGNFSVPQGDVADRNYGTEQDYIYHLIPADPDMDIREEGLIIWRGRTFKVLAVHPGLNSLMIHLRKLAASTQGV